MKTDPKIRALEVCIEYMRAGSSIEQVLEMYPQWATELRPLIETASEAYKLGKAIGVPAAAQARSREKFLQAAQARPALASRPAVASKRAPAWRFSLAMMALFVVLAAGALGSMKVSARALPGEAFYPVKLAAEQAQLMLASNLSRRIHLEQRFEAERLAELDALIRQARPARVNFTGGLVKTSGAEWQVGSVRVLLPAEAEVIGQISPGYAVQVEGELRSDGVVIARRVRAHEYNLSGRLQSVNAGQWTVDGINFKVTSETVLQGQPLPGARVQVFAVQLVDGSLQARMVESIEGGLQAPARSPSPSQAAGQPAVTSPQPTAKPVLEATSEPPAGVDRAETEVVKPQETSPTEAGGDEPPEATEKATLSPTSDREHEDHPETQEVKPPATKPEDKPEATHQPEPTEKPEATQKPEATDAPEGN